MHSAEMSRECKQRWLQLRQSGRRIQYNKVNTAFTEAQQTGAILSLPRTHHGEGRVPDVGKFDLGDGYRLVVEQRRTGRD